MNVTLTWLNDHRRNIVQIKVRVQSFTSIKNHQLKECTQRCKIHEFNVFKNYNC